MYVYNVTIKVDWSIHERWLAWMLQTEIPGMINDAYFTSYQFMKLMEIDESDGPTYAIQYRASSLEKYNSYVSDQLAADSANTYALWGQRCVFFTTLMALVN